MDSVSVSQTGENATLTSLLQASLHDQPNAALSTSHLYRDSIDELGLRPMLLASLEAYAVEHTVQSIFAVNSSESDLSHEAAVADLSAIFLQSPQPKAPVAQEPTLITPPLLPTEQPQAAEAYTDMAALESIFENNMLLMAPAPKRIPTPAEDRGKKITGLPTPALEPVLEIAPPEEQAGDARSSFDLLSLLNDLAEETPIELSGYLRPRSRPEKRKAANENRVTRHEGNAEERGENHRDQHKRQDDEPNISTHGYV